MHGRPFIVVEWDNDIVKIQIWKNGTPHPIPIKWQTKFAMVILVSSFIYRVTRPFIQQSLKVNIECTLEPCGTDPSQGQSTADRQIPWVGGVGLVGLGGGRGVYKWST